MAKLIQICASQNDLFALDDQGDAYQYNFKVKTWVKLIVEHNSEEEMPGAGAWSVNGGGATPSGEPTYHSYPGGPSFSQREGRDRGEIAVAVTAPDGGRHGQVRNLRARTQG